MCLINELIYFDKLREEPMESVPEISESSPCPQCESSLYPYSLNKERVRLCRGCMGIWLAKEQLDRLAQFSDWELALKNIKKQGPDTVKKKSLDHHFHFIKTAQCPQCKSSLRNTYFKLDESIWLDICDRCRGVFYPAGTLLKVLKLIDH